MKKIWTIILISFLGCATQEKTKIAKGFPPLGLEEPFVMVLVHNKVFDNITRSNDPHSAYLRCHSEDIANNEIREKIADIILKDHKNRFSFDHIFAQLESKAKRLGGNYVVIHRIDQRSVPSFANRVKATLYYLENIKEYELFFRWSKERNIKKSDYTLKNNLKKVDVKSGLMVETMRMIPINHGEEHYEELLNEFVVAENICNHCSDLTILRENLKFDYIELFQRKVAKNGIDRIESINNKLTYKSVFFDSLNLKLKHVDKLVDVEQIKKLNDTINLEIEKLDTYKSKFIRNGLFNH